MLACAFAVAVDVAVRACVFAFAFACVGAAELLLLTAAFDFRF